MNDNINIRSCVFCTHADICYIRRSADSLIRGAGAILTDTVKFPPAVQKTPGDINTIYETIANACIKFER